jgi:hypothetical protein
VLAYLRSALALVMGAYCRAGVWPDCCTASSKGRDACSISLLIIFKNAFALHTCYTCTSHIHVSATVGGSCSGDVKVMGGGSEGDGWGDLVVVNVKVMGGGSGEGEVEGDGWGEWWW